MKKVNSLSGGKTSSYMAMHYPADYNVFSVVCIGSEEARPKDPGVRAYTKKKLELFEPEFGAFVATAEDDMTLRAMMDLEQLMGKEITWVRGMSFDDVIDKGTQTRLPSWARRYCTVKMKLLPIFLWWFREIGERCQMRIGFRFDEFKRMERFFNNSEPAGGFTLPVSCSTQGKRLQRHKQFDWRYCQFPLVEAGVTSQDIAAYWLQHPEVKFPSVSNCIGCFHKKPDTLAAMAEVNPEKFKWFLDQELKGMGTWLDNKVTYQQIFTDRFTLGQEKIFEAREGILSCDSGGCTD